MTLESGDWVELPDGGIARIVEVDEANGTVLAATPDGHPIDRPLAFAAMRWLLVAPSDLRVRRLLDPTGVSKLVADDPVALVAAVISDRGGTASLADVRAALTPTPIGVDAFEGWWKNVQRRLASDARIDASYARDRIYRLATSLGDRGGPPGSPVTEERRNGRLLADARLLMRARALITEARGVPSESREFVEQEAGLYRRSELDATDRLLSFDLAVRAGMAQETDSTAQLGRDLLRVDLLRIRDRATRAVALRWATRFVEETTRAGQRAPDDEPRPILASAGALGDDFESAAFELAAALVVPRDEVFEGRLGWGVPGSAEAGKPKYPDELEVFDKRLSRWEAIARSADAVEVRGTVAGAVDALHLLHDSPTYHRQWLRLMDRLASFVWDAPSASDAVVLIRTRGPRLRPVGAEAVVRAAGRTSVPLLKPVVLDWFSADPKEYRQVLLDFAQRAGSDPVGLVLQIARDEIAGTGAPSLAGTAFDMARAAGRNDDLAVESANLAGTIALEHPGVADALRAHAAEITSGLLAEQPASPGGAWFTGKDWQALVDGVRLSLRTARDEAAKSVAAEGDLRKEVSRLEQALQVREQALSNTKTGQAAEDRNVNQRVAVHALRPIVKALADSYESNSLAAVQDALAAALGRARIEPICARGEVVTFDPRRHRWVGQGVAAEMALVISPGFVLRAEGTEDDVVLVPARVVGEGDPSPAD